MITSGLLVGLDVDVLFVAVLSVVTGGSLDSATIVSAVVLMTTIVSEVFRAAVAIDIMSVVVGLITSVVETILVKSKCVVLCKIEDEEVDTKDNVLRVLLISCVKEN